MQRRPRGELRRVGADRNLVFDLNDFDETAPAAWEWDIKRLAASFAVLGRDGGLEHGSRREVVLAAGGSYRQAMRQFAGMRTVEVWYARLELERQYASCGACRRAARKRLDRTLRKSRRKESLPAFSELTQEVDGEPRIVSDPPLIALISQLTVGDDRRLRRDELLALFEQYRGTRAVDSRRPLADYEAVDLARSSGSEASGWRRGSCYCSATAGTIRSSWRSGRSARCSSDSGAAAHPEATAGESWRAALDPGRKRCLSRLAPPPEGARRAPAPLLASASSGTKLLR